LQAPPRSFRGLKAANAIGGIRTPQRPLTDCIRPMISGGPARPPRHRFDRVTLVVSRSVILPDGQISKSVSSHLRKNIPVHF
jgi:hypothetical protein